MNIPAERSELHNQDHLRAGDIDGTRIVYNLSVDVIYGHVAHEKDKAYPWHKWPVYEVRDGVGTGGADKECSDSRPQVKESYEIKCGDGNDKEVFLMWFAVWNPF